MRLPACLLAGLGLLVSPLPVDAQPLDRETVLARSLGALGTTLSDHHFVDAEGRSLSLTELRGRPLVLSLVFTSCDHSCSVVTRALAERVGLAREALGDERFVVITVGFDAANDTPERMRAYARRHGVSLPGWRFLSTDETTAALLMEEVGFTAVPTARGFDHVAQTTIIDGHGKVYRQIIGEVFPLPALVEPLKELVYARATLRPQNAADWLDGLRLLCTVYDPASGQYRFDYSIAFTIGTGVLCLGTVALFVLCNWRSARPTSTRAAGTGERRAS